MFGILETFLSLSTLNIQSGKDIKRIAKVD